MHETQTRGVQRLALDPQVRIAGTVYGIADDRMTDGGAMHADLVRSSGLQRQAQQCGVLPLVVRRDAAQRTTSFARERILRLERERLDDTVVWGGIYKD